MSDMNIETIKKTYESYVGALQKLHDRGFTELGRTGSGYTHYLGEDFSCNCGVDLVKEADLCNVNVESLMDGRNPKAITKDFHIYRSDFVRFRFGAIEKYTNYSKNSFNDEKPIRESEHTLSIEFGDFGVGLGWWNDKRKAELVKMAGKCKPNVRAKIMKGIESADKEIDEYNNAKAKIMSNNLVGAE